MAVTRHARAIPRGSLADHARRNINRRLRAAGLKQLAAARHMGMSPQAFSDRVVGRTAWTLNEIDLAATTLEMDVTSILAPVDGDSSFSLVAPLEHDDDVEVDAIDTDLAS